MLPDPSEIQFIIYVYSLILREVTQFLYILWQCWFWVTDGYQFNWKVSDSLFSFSNVECCPQCQSHPAFAITQDLFGTTHTLVRECWVVMEKSAMPSNRPELPSVYWTDFWSSFEKALGWIGLVGHFHFTPPGKHRTTPYQALLILGLERVWSRLTTKPPKNHPGDSSRYRPWSSAPRWNQAWKGSPDQATLCRKGYFGCNQATI